jgi:hypothetical protein
VIRFTISPKWEVIAILKIRSWLDGGEGGGVFYTHSQVSKATSAPHLYHPLYHLTKTLTCFFSCKAIKLHHEEFPYKPLAKA